jgi:hypothetical protein
MTAFWIAALVILAAMVWLPPAVTISRLRRDAREFARRRANIRKMSTKRLLAAIEDYDRDRPPGEWAMLIDLAVKRGKNEAKP